MSAPDPGSVRDSIVACAWLTHRERVGQSGVAPAAWSQRSRRRVAPPGSRCSSNTAGRRGRVRRALLGEAVAHTTLKTGPSIGRGTTVVGSAGPATSVGRDRQPRRNSTLLSHRCARSRFSPLCATASVPSRSLGLARGPFVLPGRAEVAGYLVCEDGGVLGWRCRRSAHGDPSTGDKAAINSRGAPLNRR